MEILYFYSIEVHFSLFGGNLFFLVDSDGVTPHAHQLKNLELPQKIMSFLLQVITKFSFFG